MEDQQKLDRGLIEAARFDIARSPKWPAVEKKHLKDYPYCEVCGAVGSNQVHHIFPFHYCVSLGRPDLELDQRNLITLCENQGARGDNHHLLLNSSVASIFHG